MWRWLTGTAPTDFWLRLVKARFGHLGNLGGVSAGGAGGADTVHDASWGNRSPTLARGQSGKVVQGLT